MTSPTSAALAVPSDILFAFPGQGSQRVGMGTALLEEHPHLGRYLDLADAVSGLPVRRTCQEGPPDMLMRTDVAQPALFAVSLALHEMVSTAGLRPLAVAGHSLGEYTAAAASGALSTEDGMRLVSLRGRLMADVQRQFPGTMAAVTGLLPDDLRQLCAREAGRDVVVVANHNAPTQSVVSGQIAAVERVLAALPEDPDVRSQRLPVGAAFHSPLMAPVQQQLAEALAATPVGAPGVPILSNATGKAVTTAADLRAALAAQITAPVRWVDCLHAALSAGCRRIVELGPGRVLAGLSRLTLPQVEVSAVDSPRRLRPILEAGAGTDQVAG